MECHRSNIKVETTTNEKNLVLLDETEINWKIVDLREALESLDFKNKPHYYFTIEKNAELPELKWIVSLGTGKDDSCKDSVTKYYLQVHFNLLDGYKELIGKAIFHQFKLEVLNDDGIVWKTFDTKTTDLWNDVISCDEKGDLPFYLTRDEDGIWQAMEELPLRSDGSLWLRIILQFSSNRVINPFQKEVDPKLVELWLQYLEQKAVTDGNVVAGTGTDVEIISSDGKTAQFHKELLIARSPVLKTMLRSVEKETQSGVMVIKLEDLSEQAVKLVHHFIYDGKMLPYLEKVRNNEDLGELEQWIYIASKYELEDLTKFFDKLLGTLCSEENALELFKLSNRFSLIGAREDVRAFIREHPIVINRNIRFEVDEGKEWSGKDVERPSALESRRTTIKVETAANEKHLVLLNKIVVEWKVKDLRQALESSEPVNVPPFHFTVEKNGELPKHKCGVKLVREKTQSGSWGNRYTLEMHVYLLELEGYEKLPTNTIFYTLKMEFLNKDGMVCCTFGDGIQTSDMGIDLGKCGEVVMYQFSGNHDTAKHLELLPFWSDGSLLIRFPIQYFANRKVIAIEKEVEPKTVECWLKYFEDRAQADGKTETDVMLISKEGKNVKFHKELLSARSPVFEAMFRSEMKESQSGIVKPEDLSEQAVDFIHHYIYEGKLLQYVEKWRNSVDLGEIELCIYVASKYQFEDLIKFFDKLLGTLCNEKNALELFKLSNRFSLMGARKDVRIFIHEHPDVLNKNII